MASRTSSKILRVLKTAEASFADEWAALCDRVPAKPEDIREPVETIMANVRDGGDAKLRAYVEECAPFFELVEEAAGRPHSRFDPKTDAWPEDMPEITIALQCKQAFRARALVEVRSSQPPETMAFPPAELRQW